MRGPFSPEFLVTVLRGRTVPGHLAGTLRVVGHHSRYVLADFFSAHLIILALICAALFAILLAAPVVGDSLFDVFVARAAKVAPAVFLTGLGILLIGIVAKVMIFDVVGGCLAGAVLLGTIVVNY
jgi:hypothetical protein